MRRPLRHLVPLGSVVVTILGPASALAQQDLGHRLPGTVGLDAGTQPEPGIFVADRFLYYDVVRLRDRDGEPVPVPGLDMRAMGNAIGIAGTVRLASGLHLSAALGVPFARLRVATDDPRATLDRSGLGDTFVKPLQLGWRWPRGDVVGSYAFYAPTGHLQRSRLAASQWAHQLAAGGTVYLDERRQRRATALVSYDLHHRKRGIDVIRGDSIQVQWGLGGVVGDTFELGVTGYALWQVSDDRGDDLPEALRGRRDRVFGLGPEVGLLIDALPGKVSVRYAFDFGVEGRPEGRLFVVSVSVRAPPASAGRPDRSAAAARRRSPP